MRPSLLKLCTAILLTCCAGTLLAAELLVSAASSLSNAMKDVAQSYRKENPRAKVVLNFSASGVLLQQLAKGAPVDVLATADQETMDAAQQQNLIAAAERRDFARNTLVLIVPAASASTPQTLAQLAGPAFARVALGNPATVPAGRYARLALQDAKLWDGLQAKIIGTQNVRQSLDYIARGEADAGFVYASDAAVMPDKVKVAFEVPLAAAVRYPVAPVRTSANAEEARRFIAYLQSAPAQAIFARYGFLKP